MVYRARIVWQRTDYRTPFCFSSWSISIQIPTRRGRHHSFLANCQKVKDSILENDSNKKNTFERIIIHLIYRSLQSWSIIFISSRQIAQVSSYLSWLIFLRDSQFCWTLFLIIIDFLCRFDLIDFSLFDLLERTLHIESIIWFFYIFES